VTLRVVGGVLAVAAVLVAGCSADGIESVNAALEDRYLDPLQAADIDFAVENTCHLQRATASEPWHLEVRVQIDADANRVADILQAQDVVLVRDRDPMMVQQDRGDATRGWNGVLEKSDAGALLGLTYNNVTPGGLGEAGGWAEVCRTAGGA
jgi:predicted Zn-dependent protease